MYKISRTFFNTLKDTVNTTIVADADKLREITSILDTDNTPTQESNNAYRLKFTEVESEVNERQASVGETVHCIVEFSFEIANNTEKYETAIDTYIYGIRNLLPGDVGELFPYVLPVPNGYTIRGIENITIGELNNFQQGGNYLKPVMEFDLIINYEAIVEEDE